MKQRERSISTAVSVYIIVLLALQIFLLTVALDGLLSGQPSLSWISAATSVVLAAGAALFYRYLRGPAR